MGARMLNEWMLSTRADRREIESRREAVAEVLDGHGRRGDLREQLDGVFDLQRLTSRVSTGRASPRDLLAVRTHRAPARRALTLERQINRAVLSGEHLFVYYPDGANEECRKGANFRVFI